MCTLRCLLRRSLEIPSTPLALALLGNQLQAKVLTMDEARRIASNTPKLPTLLPRNEKKA